MARIWQTVAGRWLEISPNVRGAAWQISAGILMTSMIALVKVLGDSLPAIEILFFRGVFGLLLMVPFVLAQGTEAVATRHPLMHMVRSLTSIGAMFTLFVAVTHMPLAEATALLFSSPLFAGILAVLVLRERIGTGRAVATAVGFVGILVIVRPGEQAFEVMALVALLSAFLTAATGIIVKKLSGTDRPGVIVFWFTVCGVAITAAPAFIYWKTPTLGEWVLLVVIGCLGLLGQLAYTRAFSIAQPSAVAPFDYLRLIFAGAIGFMFFHEAPDAMSYLGTAVIVGSTFYIIRREARVGGKA